MIQAQGKLNKINTQSNEYNDCPTWRLGLFALNNTATNIYMLVIGNVSMYATGIGGLLLTAVGLILTAMRIFDGITDPIVGFLIDKSNYDKITIDNISIDNNAMKIDMIINLEKMVRNIKYI